MLNGGFDKSACSRKNEQATAEAGAGAATGAQVGAGGGAGAPADAGAGAMVVEHAWWADGVGGGAPELSIQESAITELGTVVQVSYDTRKLECVYRLHDGPIPCLAVLEGLARREIVETVLKTMSKYKKLT